jgi:hypothetical protein
MVRSILAVLAGIGVLTATSFAIEAVADPVMMRMFPHALPDRQRSATISQQVYFFSPARACAWRRWIRGGMGGAPLASVAGSGDGTGRRGADRVGDGGAFNEGPLRNWIATLVLTIPAAWCGGLLRARRVRIDS